MNSISRRQIVRGAAATAVATSFGTPSVHAQKDRQTLRFVPQAELKILDPVWTTGYITQSSSRSSSAAQRHGIGRHLQSSQSGSIPHERNRPSTAKQRCRATPLVLDRPP